MYFRFGVVFAAGLASGSSVIGFGNRELPEVVRQLELSLTSMADLKEFTRDFNAVRGGMYHLMPLALFLKNAENGGWIRAQHARITSEEVRIAFDRLISILRSVHYTNYLNNDCSPPLGEYVDKQLDDSEIRFVVDLFSMDDQTIRDDTDILSRVTDYEKMFRPIVNLFHEKFEQWQMNPDELRIACFDRNILRRVATLRTLNPEEFAAIMGTPKGLLREPTLVHEVLVVHAHQIHEEFNHDFPRLFTAISNFAQSRSCQTRVSLGKLFKFVWYYVSSDLCTANIGSVEEYDGWLDQGVSKRVSDRKFWGAICALNGQSNWRNVRSMRTQMFGQRSDIVQRAIEFMDSDLQPSFKALMGELFLSPTRSSDADILRIPALLGQGYRYFHWHRVDSNYPAIAQGYFKISADVNPIQLNYLWNELLRDVYNDCQEENSSSCHEFMKLMVLNPFTIVSSIMLGSCTKLVRINQRWLPVECRLFYFEGRCEALKESAPEALLAALIEEMSHPNISPMDSVRAAFNRIAITAENP
jgi:hypothetical protein